MQEELGSDKRGWEIDKYRGGGREQEINIVGQGNEDKGREEKERQEPTGFFLFTLGSNILFI